VCVCVWEQTQFARQIWSSFCSQQMTDIDQA
jgi:hypothetical protein